MVVKKKRLRQRRADNPLVLISVRLDHAVVDRLRKGRIRLSHEIRNRLERTFKYEEVDPVTRELVEGLMSMAQLLQTDYGCEWHASRLACGAFVAAIKQRVARYAPASPVHHGAISDVAWEQPKAVGELRESDDRRAHDYPHLREAEAKQAIPASEEEQGQDD